MMRDYELMYIVRPDLDEDALRAAARSVRGLIEAQGGEVVKTTLWGKRRLAYEVNRLRDGYYVLVALHLDGARVAAVERALTISDTVFRHLLVVHQGPMPEPDGEIEEVQLPVEDAAGAGPEPALVGGTTVDAASVQTEEDVPEEEFEEAPSASDDEGDI